jgi:hypothetical protein
LTCWDERTGTALSSPFSPAPDRGYHRQEQDVLALALRLARTPLGPLRVGHGFPDLELAALLPGTAPR